jgi:Glucodextranase, domain B
VGLRKERRMKKLVAVLIPLLVLVLVSGSVGCNKEITPTPTPTPTSMSTPTPTLLATPTTTPAALFLRITSPQDQSTVSTANVTLNGNTIPGAVVSVSVDNNVVIADIDQNGNFQTVVTLEEGPNFIEVDASDPLGNQVSANVSVIYAP